MMKMKKWLIVPLLLLSALSLQGCEEPVPEGLKRISSAECNCSMVVPEEWEEELYLHEEAVLEGGSYDLGELMMVLMYQKPSDEYSLKDYAEAVVESFREGSDFYRENRRKNLVINGIKALQITADASVAGQATSNYFTFLETDTHFYNITAWSSSAGWDQSKRRLLDAVISFDVK